MKKSYINRYALYSAVEVDFGKNFKLKGKDMEEMQKVMTIFIL